MLVSAWDASFLCQQRRFQSTHTQAQWLNKTSEQNVCNYHETVDIVPKVANSMNMHYRDW